MMGRERNAAGNAAGSKAEAVLSPPLPLAPAPPPAPPALAPLTIAEASAGMLVQEISVRASDVVFVKGIVEASEGIAVLFAERGGELTLAAPEGRGAELAELLQDLEREVGAELRRPGGSR